MKWLAGLAVALLVGYLAYYFAFPVYEHRFRLTFQVEVAGQVKEGSNVITVYDQKRFFTGGASTWSRTTRGPSPWIDLGSRGVLLVAMTPHVPFTYEPNPYAASSLSFVAYFNAKYPDIGLGEKRVRQIQVQKGLRQLRNDQMPEFVWLPNPLDRNSAQIVPVGSIADTIPGVRLLTVSVEMTDEQSENSLYSKLPWLAALEEKEKQSGVYIRATPFELHARNLVGAH